MLLDTKTVILPTGEQIFDSHAHYDDEVFDNDRDELMEQMFRSNVCGIINCGSSVESSRKSVELARRYSNFFAAVGVHPESADRYDEAALVEMIDNGGRAVAIGEIGLDYHWDTVPRDIQRQVFEKQILLAKELDFPIIVHDREAHADTLELLCKHRPRGVVHCFSGSVEMAEQVIKLGMYIGIGGVLTFKNARKLREVAEAVPLERILLETDAPYMAPEPYRGHRCNSAMISFVADKLAEIKGISRAEVLRVTRQNVRDLFGV